MKSTKIAINGFGRIGRSFFRAAFGLPEFDIIALNDLTDTKTLGYLLKYDSVYGRYQKTVEATDGYLKVDHKEIKVLAEKEPAKLPWRDLGVDIVIESSGIFTTSEKTKPHLEAGAKKVVISAPVKTEPHPNPLLGKEREQNASSLLNEERGQIKTIVLSVNEKDLSKDDKILVKPSIVTAAYPHQAVNTNPDFLNALLLVLFEYGIKKENIIVAEQALIGSDALDAASKAGILEVCKKHDVSFVDILKSPFEDVESDGYSFSIFKEALHRKIINAPVMKTNFQLGVSGAMENISRLVDEETQRKMYFDNIDKTLPKLAKALPGVFTIADATNGMQGQGPLVLGEPAFLNLVLASRNLANLDRVFSEIAMIQLPSYLATSDESINIKNIEVVGNDIDALKYPIKKAEPYETPHPDIKIIDGKACPACLNAMYNLTSKLIGLRGEEINLVIGSVISRDMLKGKDRLVALGNCAIKRFENIDIKPMAQISEDTDVVEQLVLFKKLLTEKGEVRITPIDKVKSKMKKLLSRVIQ